MAIDDLIDHLRPYNPLPIYLHGYAGPFLVLYGLVFSGWYGIYGISDYFEAGCIAMIIVGLLQILVVLFCHWFVSVRCFMTCISIKDPKHARLVRVSPCPNQGYEELVPLRTRIDANDGEILWFEFQKVTYIYDVDEKKQFSSVEMDLSQPLREYVDWKGHETDDDVAVAAIRHGDNHMEMVIPDFTELFKERATAPFFVFQVFCVGLWCLDEYWYYSIFTLAMLVAFEATLVKQQLRNMAEIRNMGNKPYMIQVFRNRRWRPVVSNELVPGDIVSIGRSLTDNLVPCDLLLLRGPCIVDESMLTGESIPQMKEPIEELDLTQVFNVETDGKLHMLFGGTKVVQHSPPSKTGPGMKAPDNGCICYVLRTGFTTAQGRLLRTILFGVKRVTANNLETFGFILFLLIFAVAAASYVWIKGTEDENRSRYKLFIECALILTSVVPPELPIELSLAVNNSLLALAKLGVYCTEPFRIPFAGKVQICCFDKTGTLTTDNLVVQGIAGLPNSEDEIIALTDAPSESVQVLVSCHSLVQLETGEMVGDPLEKACLSSADWSLTKNDTVIPRHSKELPLRIFHRHHFSSALKRMSAVVGFMPHGTSDVVHLAVVKGAPETLKPMFDKCPSDYDSVYMDITRQGARVLALGYKELGALSHQEIRDLGRDNIECGLNFAGFVVVSCPLKPDTKAMIKEILNSNHQVVMITGDNPLTACHVAKELRMTDKKKHTLILEEPTQEKPDWRWQSVDESVEMPLSSNSRDLKELNKAYDLCITGQGITYLVNEDPVLLSNLLPYVTVFARVAPKQKESVITTLKAKGLHTLMCGDGTNDVGALKHAHVGVALLSHPLPVKKAAAASSDSSDKAGGGSPSSEKSSSQRSTASSSDGPPGRRKLQGRRGPGMDDNSRTNKIAQQQKKHLDKLNSVLKELEEEEKAQIVKLGDASIAAPFTSKLSSIQCICHVIKQGRCTLVTTLQMFKILALNALVLAYSQSVLYLDGVKFSDSQATIQGLLLAACFLFISRSKPLKVLSRQRPLTNVFNLYTLLSVCLQFSVHFFCMAKLVGEAHERTPTVNTTQPVNLEEKFKPNLVNTTVYILSVTLQVATFAVNYRGHPFMESLWENKALLYSLMTSGGFVVSLAAGFLPDVAEQFELIPLPDEFRSTVLYTLLLDLTACYVIDRVLLFLLGDWRIKS